MNTILFGSLHNEAKKAILKIDTIPGRMVWQILEMVYELKPHFPDMSGDIKINIELDGTIEHALIHRSEFDMSYHFTIRLNGDGGDRIIFYGVENLDCDIDRIVYHLCAGYEDSSFHCGTLLAKPEQKKIPQSKLNQLKKELLAFKMAEIVET